ncbi:MAG: TetR/AcrR family transcriptional regulator [Hyphomonadaceae bacterium]
MSREGWISGARNLLIEGGVAQVRLEPLASRLGVTTGSFYWHFSGRDDLLAALLDDWTETNTQSFVRVTANDETGAEEMFAAFIDVWVRQRGFSPAYDAAVREWARTAPDVASMVRQVDRKRIGLLRSIFLRLGYDDDRAEVRARIMYYHQVGHYALNLKDSPDMRLRYRPLYVEALRDGVGRPKKRD